MEDRIGMSVVMLMGRDWVIIWMWEMWYLEYGVSLGSWVGVEEDVWG